MIFTTYFVPGTAINCYWQIKLGQNFRIKSKVFRNTPTNHRTIVKVSCLITIIFFKTDECSSASDAVFRAESAVCELLFNCYIMRHFLPDLVKLFGPFLAIFKWANKDLSCSQIFLLSSSSMGPSEGNRRFYLITSKNQCHKVSRYF